MLKENKLTHLRSRPWIYPNHDPYPLDVFFFRMEFTQHLDQYEHARCVKTFQWKCLICSIEAPDQVGLEMQHISDGFIYTDGINQKKWVCCNKCKKTFHLCCVTQEKEENIKFPFLCRFNECRK